MKRRVFAILLCTVMVISLAACGNKTTENVAAKTEPEPVKVEEAKTEKTTETSTEGSESMPNEKNNVTESKIDIDWQSFDYIFEDSDGYRIKRSLRISPLISSNNSDALVSAITALGQTVDDLPTVEYGNTLLKRWKQNEINEALYVVGEISLENVTEGYDIASNNSHSVIMYIGITPNEGYVPSEGEMYCEQLENDDSNSGWEITKVFYSKPMQKVGHGGYEFSIMNERNDYDPQKAFIYLGHAKMESNNWGPVRFVMMFPNKHTPALPNGFTLYDNVEFVFGDQTFKLGKIE